VAGRLYSFILCCVLCVVWASTSSASQIFFDASADISAGMQQLQGKLNLTLRAEQPVYHAQVFARGADAREQITSIDYWAPNAVKTVAFTLPSTHPAPGKYHALIELAFQDMAGANLGATIALEYKVDPDVFLHKPIAEIQGNAVHWTLADLAKENAQLLLVPPVQWQTATPVLSPDLKSLSLERDATRPVKTNWRYQAIAVLQWQDNGHLSSTAFNWWVFTDANGNWQTEFSNDENLDETRGKTPIELTSTAQITAEPDRLSGDVTLSFVDDDAIHDVVINVVDGSGQRHQIVQLPQWASRQQYPLHFAIPAQHSLPGKYNALIEIAYHNARNELFSGFVTVAYNVNRATTTPHKPSFQLLGRTINWKLDNLSASDVFLTLTTEPAWQPVAALNGLANSIMFMPNNLRTPEPNWQYGQKARLDWVENGEHFSEVSDWQQFTDDEHQWSPTGPDTSTAWWRQRALLFVLAGLFCIVGALSLFRIIPTPTTKITSSLSWVLLLGLTAWLVSHAHPELWLMRTWSTGGDIASQVFYASIFMEWFFQGKISGWLPESFAGFPAFTFYFPFPFAIAAVLSKFMAQPVAFKIASMAPAFLLPLATYVLTRNWAWPVAARLLAAAGAAGFILAESTSIWGGNILAELSGEFCYNWGMVMTVLFWASVGWALRRGGKAWLLPACLEAIVAMSHGYALLISGFGAFIYLLFSQQVRRDFITVLKIHTVAFLLIGFWLMPLFENIKWTIPNDTSATLSDWEILWPNTLWPFSIGIVALVWAFFRSRDIFVGVGFVLGVALLGLLGFHAGHNLGLAEARLFPYTVWALAVACGGALGWALQQYVPRSSTWLVFAAVFALAGWWESHIMNIEGWSHWNLSGIESKPMWPFYKHTAEVNAGPIDGPRVVFEHDPDNNDVGSTRAMEALPMFGSRPALEGLYMEAAITSPFIYQLQEEVSKRPSAPLSRYPTSARSIDRAVAHFNELYTNRLILRSDAMKERYLNDPRFRFIDQSGPFLTLELKELNTHMVDVVSEPLVTHPQKNWLDHSYRRFTLEHPYTKRNVYLRDNETLPNVTPDPNVTPHVEIKSMDREKLVFTTNAPGQPHIIRMTYHPRWQSAQGEKIYLTEPSFMLIFPTTNEVELHFGWSWGNYVGALFSITGLGIVGLLSVRRKFTFAAAPSSVFVQKRAPLTVVALLIGAFVGVSWWTDAEHIYYRGHDYLAKNDYAGAARLFDSVRERRNSPAAKAEALFWAARAFDIAGEKPAAEQRYELLRQSYPESYWFPESLLRLVEIADARQDSGRIGMLFLELTTQSPASKWTTEARKIFEKYSAPAASPNAPQ